MMRQKTRDDLGLALTMMDSDRLREWAEKLDTHGSDISHWADRRFVSEQLRAVAGRIEATVREVGTLRELAGIEAIPPAPEASPAKEVDLHAALLRLTLAARGTDDDMLLYATEKAEQVLGLDVVQVVEADASPAQLSALDAETGSDKGMTPLCDDNAKRVFGTES